MKGKVAYCVSNISSKRQQWNRPEDVPVKWNQCTWMGDDAERQLNLALASSSGSWVELEAFCHLSKLLKFGPEWKQADWNTTEVLVSASDACAPFLCRLLTWSIVTLVDDCFWREMGLMNTGELLFPLWLSGPYAFLRFDAYHICLNPDRSTLDRYISLLRHKASQISRNV